jgi:hypothetical protein
MIFAAFLLVLANPTAAPEADAKQTPEVQEAEQAGATEESGDDEVVCRRKIKSDEGVGRRNVVVKVCKTRAEWAGRGKSD